MTKPSQHPKEFIQPTQPPAQPSAPDMDAGEIPAIPVLPAEELHVNIAPAAARRLSDEGLRRLAASKQAEANLPGWQSLGKGGKPNHANGKQGPRERKVRW